MSRVAGLLIQEGCVAKIADDLYCGGDSQEEALNSWTRLLQAMHNNNLSLNAPNTVICPISTTILGWIWSLGTLRASPHKLTALQAVDPSSTVQSFMVFHQGLQSP